MFNAFNFTVHVQRPKFPDVNWVLFRQILSNLNSSHCLFSVITTYFDPKTHRKDKPLKKRNTKTASLMTVKHIVHLFHWNNVSGVVELSADIKIILISNRVYQKQQQPMSLPLSWQGHGLGYEANMCYLRKTHLATCM